MTMTHIAARTPKPIDFSTGRQPAAQWLRSVALLVRSDANGGLEPSPDLLAAWLERFDDWYKVAIGCERNERLHLLYHRDVTVVGDRLLDHVAEIGMVARRAAGLGFGFSVTIPLDEALAAEPRMNELVACPGVSTLALSVAGDEVVGDEEALARILSAIVRTKGHIGFIGVYDRIRELGLLDYPDVLSTQITIHPKDGTTGETLPIPSRPVQPCFARLRVYVDTTGEIFPCLGLVGMPAARLGRIDDPIERTVLGGQPYPLCLDRLARTGPDLTHPEPAQRYTGLPWICERHRRELLQEQEPLLAGEAPAESGLQ
jgi:hypothetical protein